MKFRLFTIFDTKAKAYLPPFCLGEVGQAIRHFGDSVNNKESAFNKHPEDYTLFEIGVFDDNKGMVESYDGPDMISTALSLVKEGGIE